MVNFIKEQKKIQKENSKGIERLAQEPTNSNKVINNKTINYLVPTVSTRRGFNHNYFRKLLEYIKKIETKKPYRQKKENSFRVLIITHMDNYPPDYNI